MERHEKVRWIYGSKDNAELSERYDKWVLLQVSEPFPPLPAGEPDVMHNIWVYRTV